MNLLAKKVEEHYYSLSVWHGGKTELFHIPDSEANPTTKVRGGFQ